MTLNRMKHSRREVIRIFSEKTGIVLTEDHFLNPDETDTVRSLIYMKVKDCSISYQFESIGEVIEDFKIIFEANQHLRDERIILLHYLDVESGAIVIKFTELSTHFEKIIDFLGNQDIVVFQNEGNFGICFEAEEHNYLKTVWGI